MTIETLAADKHPDAVYLAGLADGMGRGAMPSSSSLRPVAALLSNGQADAQSFPCQLLRFQHLSAPSVETG